MDYIYLPALPGNGCRSPSNVIIVVCPSSHLNVCLSPPLLSKLNAKYPPLNGDWNMGAACLGNHLMSTCQRYQGGTKSKTTGLSNHKRHGGTDFSGICSDEKNQPRFWQGFSFGIAHVSKINPATKLWFPFIPKVPIPWLWCRGISGRGWSEKKKKRSEALFFFDLILTFQLRQEKKKKKRQNLILTKSKLNFLNRGFIVLCKGGHREKRVALTKRFSGWLVIKLQVKTF